MSGTVTATAPERARGRRSEASAVRRRRAGTAFC